MKSNECILSKPVLQLGERLERMCCRVSKNNGIVLFCDRNVALKYRSHSFVISVVIRVYLLHFQVTGNERIFIFLKQQGFIDLPMTDKRLSDFDCHAPPHTNIWLMYPWTFYSRHEYRPLQR